MCNKTTSIQLANEASIYFIEIKLPMFSLNGIAFPEEAEWRRFMLIHIEYLNRVSHHTRKFKSIELSSRSTPNPCFSTHCVKAHRYSKSRGIRMFMILWHDAPTIYMFSVYRILMSEITIFGIFIWRCLQSSFTQCNSSTTIMLLREHLKIVQRKICIIYIWHRSN